MKREEHYCDICGKQMTEQHSDGGTVKVGIEVKNADPRGIQFSMTKRTDCGSSGVASFMRGTEYCSFDCLNKDMQRVLAEIEKFMGTDSTGKEVK